MAKDLFVTEETTAGAIINEHCSENAAIKKEVFGP